MGNEKKNARNANACRGSNSRPSTHSSGCTQAIFGPAACFFFQEKIHAHYTRHTARSPVRPTLDGDECTPNLSLHRGIPCRFQRDIYEYSYLVRINMSKKHQPTLPKMEDTWYLVQINASK